MFGTEPVYWEEGGKHYAAYTATRLLFRRDVFDQLPEGGIVIISIQSRQEPVSFVQIPKTEIRRVFENVLRSKSWREKGVYHYPKMPLKTEPFLVSPEELPRRGIKSTDIEWVQSIKDIRENLRVFTDSLEAGDDRSEWVTIHPIYFVYDPVSDKIGPAKFGAFREMTVERYAVLQALQREGTAPPIFDGHRARKVLSRILGGRTFVPQPTLAERLRQEFSAAFGSKAVQSFKPDNLRFLELTPMPAIWWVNQGKTYAEELEHEFIWAPQQSKSGQTFYYWTNVSRVRKGDLLFHYTKGVRALSIARSDGFEAHRPASLPSDEWTMNGWQANVEIVELSEPINLIDISKALVALELKKGPLTPNGAVKQGYLFAMSPEAAAVIAAKLTPDAFPDEIATRIRELTKTEPIEDDMNHPLNLVLTGPPGTGKTYRTVDLAVQICDGKVPSSREGLTARYRELLADGRIRFVTFHQSYGYEEFVEGLRPVLAEQDGESSQGDTVRYECRPGIFKNLCDAARGTRAEVRGEFSLDPEKTRVWKMSLGNTLRPEDEGIYEDCLQAGYLWLGYGQGLDYSGCATREAIREKLRSVDPTDSFSPYEITAVDTFKNKMKNGDLVVISDGNQKFRAIGSVTGDYEPPTGDDEGQRRPAEWLVSFDPSLSHERIQKRIFSQATIYELKPSVLKLDEFNALLSGDDPAPGNYVLIIDEINRGNISKILGELITLLEPDKRLGAINELQARLPYSQDEFGVPGNVYVIGTMNTADRSIAFLDTALRRRFEFCPVMPSLDVIRQHVGENGVLNGVDIAALLDSINTRLELLYDRDHVIGHAYLLEVRSLARLRDVFVGRLIPLLEEYFYGDWDKLCQVLGCPYNPDDGKALSANKNPLIRAIPLDPAHAFHHTDGDLEVRVRCDVNPEFLAASEENLNSFFNAVTTLPSTAQ